MVGIAEQGRISLHRTLQKQVSDNYPSLKNARNPFKEGKVFLAGLVLASVPCSRLQRASWSREQSDSLWYCVSHTLLPCSLLGFLVPNICFMTGE